MERSGWEASPGKMWAWQAAGEKPGRARVATWLECYGIHHRDMSVRQVKDTNRNVGGDHVEDGNGTVEFVSALLYNTMYSRDDYGNPLEEDTGKDYTNE
jgi:hypothetical protein